MTGLWIAGVLMTVAVLAAVLMPLLRRSSAPPPARGEFDLNVYKDQLGEIDRDLERGLLIDAEAEAARVEIQRRMLTAAGPDGAGDAGTGGAPARQTSNRVIAAALAVLLPAGALGIYFVLGSPDLPDRPFAERNIGNEIIAREGRLERNEVLQMAARLLKRLKKEPGDADGWVLLGRTYLTIDEFDGAIAAYRQAMEASGRQPDYVADYAEALVLANEGRIGAEARDLFEDVARARPLNLKARYYLGLDMAQQGNLEGALQAWTDLAALSSPGAPWLEPVNQQIARAAQDLGVDPGTVTPSPETRELVKNMPATPALAASPAASPAPGPAQPGPSAEDVKAAAQMPAGDRQQMIRSMVQRLADRLEDEPDDLEGWQRLARAYEVLGETAKARDAQARIEALSKKER